MGLDIAMESKMGRFQVRCILNKYTSFRIETKAWTGKITQTLNHIQCPLRVLARSCTLAGLLVQGDTRLTRK
jgi:hypothetical protein